jgi:hypothetical protein
MCSSGRGHALEHVAIEFALGAVELELDLLAGIGGSLAQYPGANAAPAHRTAPCACA